MVFFDFRDIKSFCKNSLKDELQFYIKFKISSTNRLLKSI